MRYDVGYNITGGMGMSEILDAIKRHRSELLNNEAAAAREMASAYDDALRQVRAELEKVMAAVDRASGPTKGQAIERWRLRKLEQQIRTEMSHFAAVAAGKTTQGKRDAVEAASTHTQAVLDAAVANTGITSAMADLDQRAVRNIVGTTRPGSPLRALLDDAAGQSAEGMVKALRNGIIAGHDVRTIAKNMREDGLIGRNRSILIARTEANRAYQEATHERYGSSDVVDGWIWLSSLDRRACAACLAKHGTRHPMSEPLKDHPPKRCDELPIIDGIDPPEIPDAAEWLKGQPRHVQENSLGSKAAAVAFGNGEVVLDDFVGLRRSTRWGDNYYLQSLKKAREAAALRGPGPTPPPAPSPKPAPRPTPPPPPPVPVPGMDPQLSTAAHLPLGSPARVKAELDVLLVQVERIVGRKSGWSGISTVDRTNSYSGIKAWSCSIGIEAHTAMTDRRLGTMVHELYHSISKGLLPDPFRAERALEEGVIEGMTRATLGDILKRAGHPVPPSARYSYQEWWESLETVRSIAGMDELGFYKQLIDTPLGARAAEIRRMVAGRPVPADQHAAATTAGRRLKLGAQWHD